MTTNWNATIWSQLGAEIDMLDRAIEVCPEALWSDRSRHPQFWYTVYHTLFFLDLYLSGTLEGFQPPPPFNLDELDPSGIMPAEVYPQEQMREYLAHGRAKCRRILAELTEERVIETARFPWVEMPYGELLLVSIRHVQHHTAQLNLLLRQEVNHVPRWITRAPDPI
ncbi:MAG: DinB family protein [Pyrinomonadaceae bacterium]